jgi:hypothetical protein
MVPESTHCRFDLALSTNHGFAQTSLVLIEAQGPTICAFVEPAIAYITAKFCTIVDGAGDS